MQPGDNFVLLLLIAILLIAVFLGLRRWLMKPLSSPWSLTPDDEIPITEAVALLEDAGYEVMTLKRKVPITILINDTVELESRFFVDHFVKSGEEWYVVRIARSRKPLEMTGSSIRDHLLPYQLLYPKASGVLYVDVNVRNIVKIEFQIDL
jgi:hypothetical protein